MQVQCSKKDAPLVLIVSPTAPRDSRMVKESVKARIFDYGISDMACDRWYEAHARMVCYTIVTTWNCV